VTAAPADLTPEVRSLFAPGWQANVSGAPSGGFESALTEENLRLMALDFRDRAGAEIDQRLKALSAATAFPGARSPDGALAGLWLYFGFMNEAHSICQDMPTTEGSFWHGIVHRREPDAGNAGYWFRRVGSHPVFGALHARATELCRLEGGAGFDPGRRWDPFAFIDFCEKARRQPGSAAETLAKEMQRVEWLLLFAYCARRPQ
jgi:hypothetical protein